MLAPREQVETGAASERRAVDVAGDALAQQHGDRVLDRVQARGGDREDDRLYFVHAMFTSRGRAPGRTARGRGRRGRRSRVGSWRNMRHDHQQRMSHD